MLDLPDDASGEFVVLKQGAHQPKFLVAVSLSQLIPTPALEESNLSERTSFGRKWNRIFGVIEALAKITKSQWSYKT